MTNAISPRVLAFLLAVFSLFAIAHTTCAATTPTPTRDNPLVVNKEEQSVSVYAEVNGKYLFNPTRHAVIYKEGKFCDKSVFKAYAAPKAFYDAILEIGAKPGDNMTMENKEKTNVAGDTLNVTVTWPEAKKQYSINEVIVDSNRKPIDIKFGGNIQMSLEKNTGCLICLDSCPVGITSNATYTYGAVETRNEVSFVGNKEILPPDGMPVIITVKRK